MTLEEKLRNCPPLNGAGSLFWVRAATIADMFGRFTRVHAHPSNCFSAVLEGVREYHSVPDYATKSWTEDYGSTLQRAIPVRSGVRVEYPSGEEEPEFKPTTVAPLQQCLYEAVDVAGCRVPPRI